MIYVLYSGDYEVFMGGNYLPESKVLLEPTDLALDVFESIKVPVTLFADLLCLWRYRELGFGEFPDQVDDQLRDVVRRGHDVQMHIHPHWPKTDIERCEDGSTHYQFDNIWTHPGPHFSNLYEFMLENLQSGKEYLNNLLADEAPDYRCVAYRAGGYGFTNGTMEILAALEDAGYLIDSSVVPGYPGIDVPVRQVDMRNVPTQGNYLLSRKWGLSRPADDGVFEIPVAAGAVEGIAALVRAKIKAVGRRIVKRPLPHTNIGYTSNEKMIRSQPVATASLASRVKRAITRTLSLSQWNMLDIKEDAQAIFDITQSYVRRYQNESPDLFFSVSFHPKEFVAERREALRKYHGMLKRYYGDNIRAITFRQAAELISPQLKKSDE
ncbi:MAG: hypothetical protein FVQ79_00995 [Planctomycetes bacterium]|nr:hypothetical protein [Planctomycetota bacterium]